MKSLYDTVCRPCDMLYEKDVLGIRLVLIVGATIGFVMSSTATVLSDDDRDSVKRNSLGTYELQDNEPLKLVPPPYPGNRLDLYYQNRDAQAKRDGDFCIVFNAIDGRLIPYGVMGDSDGCSLCEMFWIASRIPSWQIDMNAEVRRLRFKCDVVIRPELDWRDSVTAFTSELERCFGNGLRIEVASSQREVYVARGTISERPDRSPLKRIHLFGESIGDEVPHTDMSGTGTPAQFISALGDLLETPVFDELSQPQVGRVRWRGRIRSPFSAFELRASRNANEVLKHVAAQTGIQFALEKRDVPFLHIVLESPR